MQGQPRVYVGAVVVASIIVWFAVLSPSPHRHRSSALSSESSISAAAPASSSTNVSSLQSPESMESMASTESSMASMATMATMASMVSMESLKHELNEIRMMVERLQREHQALQQVLYGTNATHNATEANSNQTICDIIHRQCSASTTAPVVVTAAAASAAVPVHAKPSKAGLPVCDASFGVANGWNLNNWRVVSDASLENDIRLLGDAMRPGKPLANQSTDFGDNDEWPFHVSDRHRACSSKARASNRLDPAAFAHDYLCSARGRPYWTCDYRNHVMVIPCGGSMGPMNYDAHRSFPQRLQIHDWNAPAQVDFSRQPIVYDELAVVTTCYSDAWGHFGKDLLPRLFAVLKWVPNHVPIAIGGASTLEKWLPYLQSTGVLNLTRVIPINPDVAYYARLLYVAGELSRPNATHQWKSNSHLCTWRHGLPGYLIKDAIYGDNKPARLRRIVYIDRRPKPKDIRRVIKNHAELYGAINETFHDFEILSFNDAPRTVDQQISFFNQSALLIGAHGAGMIFLAWLPSTAAVVEIGHTAEDGGMGYPDGDFPAYGRGLGLDYSITYADGSHDSLLFVNVTDTIQLSIAALVRIGLIHHDDDRVTSAVTRLIHHS